MYAAFVVWLLLILGMGVGVYRLWANLVLPGVVNWALLPGTIVSEMAFMFGCLVTGGEIPRPKSSDSEGRSGKKKSGWKPKPGARLGAARSVTSSLLATLACAGAIVIVWMALGEYVVDKFDPVWTQTGKLPVDLPTTWGSFWHHLDRLVRLQRHTCEALPGLKWLEWEVALFVYVSMCLAIRLIPGRGTARQRLAAVIVLGGIIGLIAAFVPESAAVIEKGWPLLTYVWTSLLTLLLATLLLRGFVAVTRVVAGTSKR